MRHRFQFKVGVALGGGAARGLAHVAPPSVLWVIRARSLSLLKGSHTTRVLESRTGHGLPIAILASPPSS